MQPAFDSWTTVDVIAPCAECGAEVTAKIPDFARGMYRAHCEPCSVKAAAAQSEAEEAKERSQAATRFEAGIPKAYRWAAVGSPTLRDRVQAPGGHLDALTARVGAARGNLILAGPAGTGKTSMAVAGLRALCESKRYRLGAKFFHASQLGVVRIQTPAGHGESPMVLSAMTCELALIDDVGSERATANNAIPDIIQWRHAEQLPTWITTGLSHAQLVDRYNDGTVRRLLENAEVIRLGKVAA